MQAAEADDGWSPLGRVGSHIANQASFDSRNYGYKKLVDLFRASDLFELETRDDKGVFLRDKRKPRSS